MNVLKRINSLRLEREWSVYRLSIESGIPQSTITNMFNRETLPSITTLEQLCAAFGITMAEFFTEPTQESNCAEEELINAYHALSDEMQSTVLALVKELKRAATK